MATVTSYAAIVRIENLFGFNLSDGSLTWTSSSGNLIGDLQLLLTWSRQKVIQDIYSW